MEKPFWRATTTGDLDEINKIADQIHTNLPERDEVFAEKFSLFPEGCFVFTRASRVLGYGISHPWELYNIPALDTFLGSLPTEPKCLFIHDVAILPEGRRCGGAGQFVRLIEAAARSRRIPFLALVSVYNTSLLWSRFGFEIVFRPALQEKLEAYGATARYMIRKLAEAT